MSQLIYRITVIWRSLLSWMRWRRRARQREQERQAALLDRLEAILLKQVQQQAQAERLHMELAELRWKLEASQRSLLLEALRPVAEAMHRQDSLRQDQFQVLQKLGANLEELQLEVLNSLQPPVDQQLFPRLGQPPQRQSSPSLAS